MNAFLTVLLTALALAAIPAAAQRERLDDSLSPVARLHIELDWGPDAIEHALESFSRPRMNVPVASGQLAGVEVLLDTSEFIGRHARIYLALPLPASSIGDVDLQWEASGEFLPGSVRPGQSALVFEGEIAEPVTGAVFNFELSVTDGTGSEQNRMEAVYEIELLP